MSHQDQYTLIVQGEILIFHFLETSGFAQSNLRDAIRQELANPDRGDFRHVIVDCTDLKYANSMFLETLLEIKSGVDQKSGTFALCGVTGTVDEVIRVSHLDQIWPMHKTRNDAIKSIPS